MSTAIRRLVVLDLIEAAGRLQSRPGAHAAKLHRDCWSTAADLETGCDCLESAATLVTSARAWLGGAA